MRHNLMTLPYGVGSSKRFRCLPTCDPSGVNGCCDGCTFVTNMRPFQIRADYKFGFGKI